MDALREDFVEFDKDSKQHTQLEYGSESNYKGQQIEIFKSMREKYPLNTFLMPSSSEMPTLTTMRVKSFMTGSVNSVYEMNADLVQPEIIQDDNILNQIRKQSPNNKLSAFGEKFWL